jgi:hypothetical protein
MTIKTNASITIGLEAATLADVRVFLAEIEKYNLPDDTEILTTFLLCVLNGDVEPSEGGVTVKGLKADVNVD